MDYENNMLSMHNVVIEVKDSLTKTAYTRKVLEALPEWFGNKQALDEYVAKVAELPYWAAIR